MRACRGEKNACRSRVDAFRCDWANREKRRDPRLQRAEIKQEKGGETDRREKPSHAARCLSRSRPRLGEASGVPCPRPSARPERSRRVSLINELTMKAQVWSLPLDVPNCAGVST